MIDLITSLEALAPAMVEEEGSSRCKAGAWARRCGRGGNGARSCLGPCSGLCTGTVVEEMRGRTELREGEEES